MSGRFDGLVFSLRYFDGNRATMLEIEPNKKYGRTSEIQDGLNGLELLNSISLNTVRIGIGGTMVVDMDVGSGHRSRQRHGRGNLA